MARRVTVILTALSLLATAACSGPNTDGDWTVTAALEDLPVAVARGGSFIAAADVDGALKAAGLTPSDDITQVTQWVGPFSRGIPVGDGAPAAPFVPFPDEVTGVPAGLFEATAGFHIGEVSSFASVAAPPLSLAVYEGIDDYSLPENLAPVKDGIVTDIEGEDGEADSEAAGALSPLGRPTRFATKDGAVALSSYTNLLEDWKDGGETVADEPAFSDVAEALDKVDVLSAVLTLAAGWQGRGEAPATPFDTVGLGWSADAMHVVYRFTEAPDVDALERLWRDTTLLSDEPMSDYLTVESVNLDDKVATVTLKPVGDTPSGLLVSLLMSGEPLFLSAA